VHNWTFSETLFEAGLFVVKKVFRLSASVVGIHPTNTVVYVETVFKTEAEV